MRVLFILELLLAVALVVVAVRSCALWIG